VTSIAFLNKAYSQNDMLPEKKRLIAEIGQYDFIESYCLGLGCNSISALYKKADSLLLHSSEEEMIAYFNGVSYSLKYYSFLHILENNDSLAFQLLRLNIRDEKRMDYTFGDVSSNTKFIHLLAGEYRNFIQLKYLSGGRVLVRGHRLVNFPSKDKKKYRRKIEELNRLLQANNVVLK